MTAPADSAPLPGKDHSSGASHKAPAGAPGRFTAPAPQAGEPLLRLDSARPAPQQPPSQPGTALSQKGTDTLPLTARGRDDGDRRRPTELAGPREEQRQIMAISGIVCRATLEALEGTRPVLQLQRWMELETWEKVAERTELMAAARRGRGAAENQGTSSSRPVEVRNMRCARVRPGVWEVAVVLSDELRTRACGLRLEAHRRRWRVVALELG